MQNADLPLIGVEAGRYFYRLPDPRPNLQVYPEASMDLDAWMDAGLLLSPLPEDHRDPAVTRVPFAIPSTVTNSFFRLRLEP